MCRILTLTFVCDNATSNKCLVENVGSATADMLGPASVPNTLVLRQGCLVY